MPLWWRFWVADVAKGARLWLLHQGMRALPTEAASALGGGLARLSGPRTSPVAERRAADLIRALRPDLAGDPAALAGALASLWSCVGRTHGEFAAEPRLWREGRIAVEGAEHVAAGGGPLVVAGVHLGNWELLPIALAHLGHRVVDVYQPQPNRFVDRIAERSRLAAADAAGRATGRKGPDLFRLVAPSPAAGAELVRAVKAGWTMMMYVDEEVAGRCHSPTFGEACPGDGNLRRAVRIARLTGARIVPAHVERLAGARFLVRFGPPIGGTGEAGVAALDAAVSDVVRRHLCQWFMLLSYRGAAPLPA